MSCVCVCVCVSSGVLIMYRSSSGIQMAGEGVGVLGKRKEREECI